MIKNAYIHIPFCLRKCNYCSFVSYNKLELKDEYINALCTQIESNYGGEFLETIYFGGGTPSLLSVRDFGRVLGCLNFNSDTEITVEVNPETVNKEYLENLRKIGVNRLSVGVQAFDDKTLKLIGRNHRVKDALVVVSEAREAGFQNISIDLIYGLPGQNIEKFKKSLDCLSALNIVHVSLYGLKIEKGSIFYNQVPNMLPDDDEQADMYLFAVEYLIKNQFEHYEISNFAKKGFESKHNLSYWDNKNYYGFGCAASGYEADIRYSNEKSIEEYIKDFSKKEEIKVTLQEKLEEEIFLGLRKLSGIDVCNIEEKYSINFNAKYGDIIEKYITSGHLIATNKGYRLTLEGILTSNSILSEFIEC